MSPPARHAARTPSRPGHAARIIARLAAMTATAALTLAFLCTALDMLTG